MKGILPFCGRFLSPRFILLSAFLLLFSVSVVRAKTVVIGTGFGFVSVTNMNGLNPGDVLAIQAGQYTGGSFQHLNGITITNNGGTVIFGGQVSLNSLVGCTFSGFQFSNMTGIAIRWDGNFRRCVEKNISFYNVNGSANDAADNNLYNGDTSSLKFYQVTFDSLTLFKTGLLLQGSWGDVQVPVCFMDSVIFSRIKIDSTTSNGTEVRGTIFRANAYDWRVTYNGVNTVLGDVGIFYMIGNGYFHNIYRTGGRGYIMRLWNCGLGSTGKTYFYNNIDLNSTVYGTIDTRVEAGEISTYTTGGNCYVYNNTSGNKSDNIGYWASVAVIGQYPAPWICEVKNNLGFNLLTRGKPPIAMDQSSQTWVPDSSNNMYFASSNGVVDPVTGIPVANSPVLGKGVTVSWITDDYYHNPRLGAYDIGAVQHGGTIIPPPNQPPVAVANPKITITLPVNTANLDGSKSYDPDNGIASYLWVLSSGTGGTITSPNTSTTTVTGLTQGTYIYKLTVTDNSNATSSAFDTVVVNPAANLPPIANAGAGQTITLPTNSVTVDGSASKDQDGTITAYAWSQTSGPSAATIASPATVSTGISGLQQGIYIFALKVTDNSGATASDTLTITVNAAANLPPVANAGSSKSITLPVNSVTLDGSLSSDPDGTISSYSWIQVTGPSASTLTGATASVATASNLVAGQYTFQLTVTDNKGASSSAQVKITVSAAGPQPPVANAGANQTITLPTNSVTIDGSGSTASSGSIASYVWSESSGPSAVSLTNTAQDVLNNLKAGIYIFLLTVTDNTGGTASDSVTITVNAAPNIAPVANAGPSMTITLPTNSATLDGSKSYDPDGTISTYAWTQISGPNNPGVTGPNTASLGLSGLIFGQYTYQLTVTDNSGASSNAQVKITVVNPPNIPPVADAGADQTITAPANSVNLDGTGSSDPDGTISAYSWVKVSGPGTITISNSNTATPSVIGLQPGTYVFELTVTDNNGATATDQVTVTVNPQPIVPNQVPVANAGSNLTITAPANSISLDGNSSFDPDGSITGYSWRQVSGPSISVISGANTATPGVSQLVVGQYMFELTVTDNDGATAKDQVTVTVNPAVSKVDQSPVASAGPDATITLPVNTYVLDASLSNDPDGTISSYQWQELNGPTTVTSTPMDNSKVTVAGLQIGTYEFQVTVTDNQGVNSTAMMTITVEKGSGVEDQLLIYPNPAHDVVNGRITSTVTGTTKINVYDMNGRTVLIDQVEKTSDVVTRTFTISQLAAGMYTIQINIANRKTMVSKFIKN